MAAQHGMMIKLSLGGQFLPRISVKLVESKINVSEQSISWKFGPMLLKLMTIIMVFMHPSNRHVKAI